MSALCVVTSGPIQSATERPTAAPSFGRFMLCEIRKGGALGRRVVRGLSGGDDVVGYGLGHSPDRGAGGLPPGRLKDLRLVEDRFGFCPEVTARLARVPGVRWAEVPVAYHPRSHAQGKKIGFRDGLRALYCIGKYTWPWRRREASGKR